MTPTRRDFLKFTASGIAVTLLPVQAARAALFEDRLVELPVAPQGDMRLKRRIDGVAKVTGSKVFARDIRARDMQGWPSEQAHAFMVLSPRADAPYLGLDLSVLGSELLPDVVVDAEKLQQAGLDFYDPFVYGKDMLLPRNRVPLFLGYPLAILIYRDFSRFSTAKRLYKSRRQDVIRYGETTEPVEQGPQANFRFVRMEGDQGSKGARDRFNAVDDSYVFARYDGNAVVWPRADASGAVMERGMGFAEAIRAELQTPAESLHVIERSYHSPYIDGAALEGDNCNGWYDAKNSTLELVMASQSPHEVMTGTAAMLEKSAFKVSALKGHSAYTVGYGTKDHSPFPFYGVVAALFAEGLAVRLAFDREEQFQAALKRHAFDMTYRIGIDRQSLKMQALSVDLALDGGGRQNFTTPVVQVAAGAAQGIYYFPKSDIVGIARSSRAPTAGSMRGFGALEAQFGTEMLIDELAGELGVDPMQLRLANALQSGERNSAGAVPLSQSRLTEIIEQDRQNPVWVNRASRKIAFEADNPALKYGVGYAIGKKAFGSTNEGVAASVELDREGRVHLQHIAVEIGTGAVSTQALLCAHWFGKSADTVESAAFDWSPLQMYETLSPFVMDKAYQDKMTPDPRWTPAFASPSSASNSAYYFSHATHEAGRLIFEQGIVPAAAKLWDIPQDQAAQATWVNERFVLSDGRSLTLKAIAAMIHETGAVAGAMVHGFDRWGWGEADFTILGQTARRPLDGLAIRAGSGDWQWIKRSNMRYPDPDVDRASWSRFSAISALIEVSVNRGTGAVTLLSHHSTMDCGRVIVPEFVSGQLQGGIAMSIGHALYESMPLYEGGPGSGNWNFNRYRLPRGVNVAVWNQSATMLPALADENYPKGIAEVVQIPTIPAIGNAVAHAIGLYLRDLPLSEEKIREALS